MKFVLMHFIRDVFMFYLQKVASRGRSDYFSSIFPVIFNRSDSVYDNYIFVEHDCQLNRF